MDGTGRDVPDRGRREGTIRGQGDRKTVTDPGRV